MKYISLSLVGLLLFVSTACPMTPLERTAYRTVVASKAFLDTEKRAHPECLTVTPVTKVCSLLTQATAAKDTLIDAVNLYCSSPDYENGGVCQPPTKGTPAAQQVTDKLKAAIANYDQIAKDLKGAL